MLRKVPKLALWPKKTVNTRRSMTMKFKKAINYIYIYIKTVEKDCCQNIFRFNNDCIFSFD